MKINFSIPAILLSALLIFSCKPEPLPPDPPPDPPEGYSQYSVPFEDVPQTEDIVMYEVNLRAFSSSGDLKGLIARLDELKKLNVNTIWLMPIYPIGEVNSVNSPYSVKDFKAVSSEYGSLADLRKLTDEAHQRGMAVILDWVANHTAWDNEWIENKSWYSQDANGNIIIPPGTNWQDVADLNFGNPEMRRAMIDAMKYWVLEANVDGFRCDYADGVPYSFWNQAFDSLDVIPNREYILLAEGEREDHFAAGFDLNFGWGFYGHLKSIFAGNGSIAGLYNLHNLAYDQIPSGKHQLRFTTNHDESAWDKTPMVLFKGKQGALAASVVTIFMGGVPMIYTGQEVGRMANVPFFSNSPISWTQNPDMLQTYQDILAFYAQSEAARKGALTTTVDNDVVFFSKKSANDEIQIIANVRNQQTTFDKAVGMANPIWKNALTGETVDLSNAISLEAFEFLILKRG
jgi:glycosidase